jgi:Zn-dependent protease with chaperone function
MPGEKPPKLNIFALPSQTSLLFLIIVVVLGIPVLLSGSSSSFLLLPVLPAGVALLTLWEFLRQPDVQRRRWRMEELPAEHDWLRDWIGHLAQQAELQQLPHLLVAHGPLGAPFAFGTWRRHYLAFPAWLLPEMAASVRRTHSDDPAAVEAVLRHELAHFANQDVWLASFSRSLLKMTVIFMAANWFAMLWLPFTYELLRQAVADWSNLLPAPLPGLFPADIQQFISQPPPLTGADVLVMETMIGVALWPLIVSALLLWRTTWNALLQVREQAADARVASWLRSAAPVGRAMHWFNGVQATAFVAEEDTSTWDRLRGGLRTMLGTRRAAQPLAWPGAAAAGRWWSPQPLAATRHATLAQPEQAYGSATTIGRRAGLAVLLLYGLLASIFAPAGQGVNSEVAVGLGFILLALGLTPMALVDGHNRRLLLRQVGRAVAIYALLFGSVVMVMLGLAALVLAWQPRSLDLTLYAIAMVAPRGDLSIVVDDPNAWLLQAFFGALLTFGLGMPLLMLLAVVADLTLKRWALTWYAAPLIQRRPQLFFLSVTAIGLLVLWWGAVPLLNLVAFPTIFQPDKAFWLRLSLTALLVVLALGTGLSMHARYARRCSGCAGKVPGPYRLGQHCPECGHQLNPWLVARY